VLDVLDFDEEELSLLVEVVDEDGPFEEPEEEVEAPPLLFDFDEEELESELPLRA
jgi:hypothetical protein